MSTVREPMTIKDLIGKIEGAYGGKVGPRTSGPRAPTGESFHTFAVIAPSQDAAIRGLQTAVFAYLVFAPPNYTLYWRKKPEIEPYDEGGVQIRCRLLASNCTDLSPQKRVKTE